MCVRVNKGDTLTEWERERETERRKEREMVCMCSSPFSACVHVRGRVYVFGSWQLEQLKNRYPGNHASLWQTSADIEIEQVFAM